ncbi:MAG TPA: type III pantothenate kinase [Phycisphaerales bacterium]|nr:type III pantothenate kinase [Phycisphaerales bacterium]
MPTDLVLVSIGNTRTRIAPVVGGSIEPSRGGVIASTDAEAVAAAIVAAFGEESTEQRTAMIASVNAPATDRIVAALSAADVRLLRFGLGADQTTLPIPITHTLDDASTVGQDRLLDALGAFARSNQACVVIDAGTAVTVDFVDGEGTFHGGVIAPGLRMMLAALHSHTAALPRVEPTRELMPPAVVEEGQPASDPFGKTTAQAMVRGAAGAIRGLVHFSVDQFATFYGAYPRVVATGGDAPLLFENDPLVEAIVPDLTLIGMLEAAKRLDSLATEE